MKVETTSLLGVKIVQLDVHGDHRGFFIERYQEEEFRKLGLPTKYYQDNHSRSAPGVLRGLHYQYEPAQGKLVGCINGTIWDVAVDVRPTSATFGKYIGVELSDVNGKLLWIPPGIAHGFCVLGDQPADVLYKVTSQYNPVGEGGIMWNDPDIGVDWPIDDPTISERDQQQQSFAAYKNAPPEW